MRLAGARIAETVGLDLADLPSTQRRRRLRVRGKGRRNRTVPVHPDLAAALDGWLDARRSWPGADASTAVFLNRAGGRLSARSADEVIAAIARAAGLEEVVTPHVLRHTFGTDLILGGTDVVTVAELMGHASLDSTRIYTLPTEGDLDAAVARPTVRPLSSPGPACTELILQHAPNQPRSTEPSPAGRPTDLGRHARGAGRGPSRLHRRWWPDERRHDG